ncbi:helix-turn-helix domain-containing protein [Paenibacillus sp. WLX2291]|uniref:helix-turn-helix domain-containing protein n=1 Tax=Paenibacillus sp. WLX2291 TaxID=3296934 RepID=UPI0039842FF2
MEIGEHIRSLREESEISQTEFAKYTHINNSVLSRIEAGKCAFKDQEIKDNR